MPQSTRHPKVRHALLFILFLVLPGLLLVPTIEARPDPDGARQGWQSMEGAAYRDFHGAAFYQSPMHSRLDMMRVGLSYPHPVRRFDDRWLDLSGGVEPLFGRYQVVVEDFSRRLDEADPDHFIAPEPGGPMLVGEALRACESRGLGLASRADRNELAACMLREVLGPAELRLTALFKKNTLTRGGSGRPRVISELVALQINDVANGNSNEIARLPGGQMCTDDSGPQLCASCRGSFMTLASGRGGNMPCRSGDELLSISARFSYAMFAQATLDMEEPRLSFLFRDSDGNDYTVRYRTEGLLAALFSR